jgi:predicted DNA-binding ribbon-helix-helix protein
VGGAILKIGVKSVEIENKFLRDLSKFASRRDEAIWHIFTEVPKSSEKQEAKNAEGYK